MTKKFEDTVADFTSHHVEGIAREGNVQFKCPLITQVDGHNLWQGGCIDGVSLGGKFHHVISLYPWERFNYGRDLDSLMEVRLYDGPVVPDEAQLYVIARWINVCRQKVPTLVHCQAGLNRSALVTGLALVLAGTAPELVIEQLRRRSPAVLCNKKFEEWLLSRKVFDGVD